MSSTMDDLRELPTDKLAPPWVLLRPVNRHSVAYAELKDSIEAKGFLNSISARPCKRRPGLFEVIDGMYRWACAKELCLATVPTIVKHNVTDEEVLSLQIQANAVRRKKTTPCDFARQLLRIQKANPGITMSHLATMVSKNPSWIGQQLGLLDLKPAYQQMLDRGEMCLQNAYMLAKLPPRFRSDYIDQAKTMPTSEFNALAAGVVKRFKEAVRQGKLDAFFTDDYEPQAYLRSRREALKEYRAQTEGPLIVSSEDCRTPLDGWVSALQWMLHLDRESVEAQEEAARAKARVKWES